MALNPDLVFHLDCLTRLIYYVTDEDDRFIAQLHKHLPSLNVGKVWVFNAAFGLHPIDKYIENWTAVNSKDGGLAGTPGASIHDALMKILQDDPKMDAHLYVITDAERWFKDEFAVRRVLNVVQQCNQNTKTVKVLLFVGTRKVIPQYLNRYVTVLHDRGLDESEISEIINEAVPWVEGLEVPKGIEAHFRGLTSFEVRSAVCQSIVRTSESDGLPRIDPQVISSFRQQQFAKTDLLQYIDTSQYDMRDLGGVSRFKDWAAKTASTWTAEGRAFGLKPPKGVLCVGVWGCGKSLSMKVLGRLWNLPVVQLELGRIRSNQVGESEANAYRVLRLIESAAPCIVWVDEAEKSLSGMASSAQSDAGITNRIIGIFSTWLQETKAPVCLAMTANSLDTLPTEFVNRMDERFFFDVPSTADRIDILKIHLAKMGQDVDRFDLVDLAEHAQSMVGREIEQAINAAMIESFHAGKPHLDPGILATTLARKPRIVRTMQDQIQALVDWVGYDTESDDGIKARYAAKPERAMRKVPVYDD